MDLRPKLHFTPRNNWMNDPNGFCHFVGLYHLYFQHNPYGKVWGTMHWGHAVSEDLLHWEELPVVMKPEFDFDAQGVFSGSVLIEEGRQHFYYTGVRYMDGARDISRTYQTVGYAWSEDGQTLYREPEPVMIPDPDIVTVTEFRDPKLWQHSGHIYMIIGGSFEDKGQAYIYRQNEKGTWELFTVLHKENSGRVWECPDIIDVSGRLYLTASIMDVNYGGQQHIAVIAPLMLNYETGEWFLGDFQPMDHGLDFYAVQSMTQVAKGMPPVVIGWLRMTDVLDKSCSWTGMQSIPRKVTAGEGGIVYSLPDAIEGEAWKPFEVSKTNVVEPPSQTYLLKGRITLTKSFSLELFSDGDTGLSIGYDATTRKFYADRSDLMAGAPGLKNMPGKLWFPKVSNQITDITILADRSVIEIFLDGGTKTMTLTFNPKSNNTAIDLSKAAGHIEVNELMYL